MHKFALSELCFVFYQLLIRYGSWRHEPWRESVGGKPNLRRNCITFLKWAGGILFPKRLRNIIPFNRLPLWAPGPRPPGSLRSVRQRRTGPLCGPPPVSGRALLR
jgi:hypothetical protein